MKIEQIGKKLDKAKKEYEFWVLAKQVYNRMLVYLASDLTVATYQFYILTGSVTDAAKELNATTNRSFTSNDISSTIDKKDIQDKELQYVARELLRLGRSSSNKWYN